MLSPLSFSVVRVYSLSRASCVALPRSCGYASRNALRASSPDAVASSERERAAERKRERERERSFVDKQRERERQRESR